MFVKLGIADGWIDLPLEFTRLRARNSCNILRWLPSPWAARKRLHKQAHPQITTSTFTREKISPPQIATRLDWHSHPMHKLLTIRTVASPRDRSMMRAVFATA